MTLPTERQWVTIGLYVMASSMIWMGYLDRSLWSVELFKVIVQAVVISGFINMVLAFHFAANKSDEDKTQNTRAAFDAITATANASSGGDTPPDVILKPGETAQAEEPKP